MPRKNPKVSPTNGTLEQAMALLIENQAAFMSTFLAHVARTEERFAKADERFENIERLLLEHSRILTDLQDSVARLPEAIREKIGFKRRG